ncbi:serine/threonine protein kinase [Pseudanabaena sp. FACHB-1277]|uniref:Serine/threonine protein kinase n=1 Tax=Pseudanabaena cinerea FACHB-1277 TaxID=2949581 RepID=A0A926UPT3_9CYAN|nr:serine/threonine-protein kinase [Pseudanabaena cinerea]MBD2148621.1 serine/threonine protein kinase [Pseudanabaena cinerea FACHB-1277]
MAFADGWLIDGTNYQYRIVKVIGEGGFGITYLAKRNDGSDVVVKTLNDKMQNERDFNDLQAKFMKEAFFLKGCKHPHIVKILDICQSVNLWCMVMDAIDGETLWERVEKKGALPESEALGYIQQIGSALEYMHNLDEPLLHRDLNPKNIMIRRQTKDAVLIDFGLAREFVQDKTGKHTAMAFPGFAPIEQYDYNAKRGAYTDVYGLAAALYFALTAECPTPSFNIVAGVALVPPRRIQPNIDGRVEKAILHGMKLKASDRPQSVQKWIDELIPPPPKLPKPPKATVRQTSTSSIIKNSTWIALGLSFTIYAATGIALAIAQAKSAVWLLLVESIVMISLSPLVGDWLNGLEKQGKLKGFWKKFLVVFAIAGINAILSTLALNQVAIAYDKNFSFQELLIIGAVAWGGGGFGTLAATWSWAWAMAWAVAWGMLAGTGTWAVAAAVSTSVAMNWAVTVAVAVAAVVAGSSEELLESVGKWKATMILFATGLAALGVGLLVKVLFVR